MVKGTLALITKIEQTTVDYNFFHDQHSKIQPG